MMHPPSLASLRLFLLVARTLNFSEAARQANLSQPALSRTIRLLEEQLDARLFDRNSRNVELTPAGEALVPVAERLADEFDHAFSALARNFAGERGRIVIGALPTVAAGILPAILATFRQEYPAVEITLRDRLSGNLLEQLQSREIDLAFTTPPDDPAFEFEPLLTDSCVLVCEKGSPLDRHGDVEWSVFEQYPFIAMAPDSSVRKLTDLALSRAKVTVRPLFEPSQLPTVGGLVAAGLGITLLPRMAALMLGTDKVAYRSLEAPVAERTIGIARLAERTLNPAAAHFLAHFRKSRSEADHLSR